MLHGGKVLMGKKDLITNTMKWYPSILNPFVEASDNIIIVIDDVYCTYRKALAEGKTIQYMGSNLKPDEVSFTGLLEKYEIKPEPEFKVGDWVIVNGPAGTFTECISGINDDTYTLSRSNICYKSQATKWEPKEGEVCIFWDNCTDIAIISEFSRISHYNKYMTINMEISYDNCIPFTGTLPPHMKESK